MERVIFFSVQFFYRNTLFIRSFLCLFMDCELLAAIGMLFMNLHRTAVLSNDKILRYREYIFYCKGVFFVEKNELLKYFLYGFNQLREAGGNIRIANGAGRFLLQDQHIKKEEEKSEKQI